MTGTRFSLWVPVIGLLTAGPARPQDPSPQPVRALDLSADGRMFDQMFQRFGPRSGRAISPERAGVRFQIPAEKGAGMVGYNSAFSLAGDFEVEAAFEIVRMPAPTAGYGVSLGLTADAQGADGACTLARGLSADGKPQFAVVRSIPASAAAGAETKYEGHGFPVSAAASRGRLVLRREKKELVCLAADVPDGEPRELKRLAFTDRPVRLKLHADTGGSPTGLVGRFWGVRVTADEIAGGLTRAQLADQRSYWWWWVPVSLGAAGAAWVLRRRRRARTEAT